jgi:hypothetical protein
MASLIEPDVKVILYKNLQSSHATRINYYLTILNIILFVSFVVIVGGIVYYKCKHKISPAEKQARFQRDKENVLSMIRHYKMTAPPADAQQKLKFYN